MNEPNPPTLKWHLPLDVTVIRDAPRYPSWPAPIRRLVCGCGFAIVLEKSGGAQLRHALSGMQRHGWFNAAHNRWVTLGRPTRRRSPTLKSSRARAGRKRKAPKISPGIPAKTRPARAPKKKVRR